MGQLSRAQLLSAAGSLVLSADADLAKVAATAELLAIDFYKHAIASRHFKGDERAYLAAARDNEIEHYDLLKVALGKAAPHGLRFKYPNGVFTSRTSVATLGQALETAFLGTYLGAVGSFRSNALKSLAGQIAATESRHLGVLTNIAAGAIVPAPDLPRIYSGVEALDALKPFLA